MSMFPGKTPTQLLQMVPLVFTLCGNAQAYTALRVCQAAEGISNPPEIDTAQRLLLQLESLREHAWRILLDWPKFIGDKADKAAMSDLLKFDRQFKGALFKQGEAFKFTSVLENDTALVSQRINVLQQLITEKIFSGQLEGFLELTTEAQFHTWLAVNPSPSATLLRMIYQNAWAGIGQNSIGCLPKLDSEALDWHMQQSGLQTFVKSPQWQGNCYESTVLNRQRSHPLIVELTSCYGNSLLVRLVARLLEVAYIIKHLQLWREPIPADSLPLVQVFGQEGVGLVQVQAARGLLLHRLVLEHGRVQDYRIVAPTEWNFHPNGVVTASLQQLQADSIQLLQQQAELLINAIDPCVEYQLNMIAS